MFTLKIYGTVLNGNIIDVSKDIKNDEYAVMLKAGEKMKESPFIIL